MERGGFMKPALMWCDVIRHRSVSEIQNKCRWNTVYVSGTFMTSPCNCHVHVDTRCLSIKSLLAGTLFCCFARISWDDCSRVWRWTSSAAGDEDWRSVCWCHENKKRKVLKAFCIQTAKTKRETGIIRTCWSRMNQQVVSEWETLSYSPSAALHVPLFVPTHCAHVLSRQPVLCNSSDLWPCSRNHLWSAIVDPSLLSLSEDDLTEVVSCCFWLSLTRRRYDVCRPAAYCCWVCLLFLTKEGRKCFPSVILSLELKINLQSITFQAKIPRDIVPGFRNVFGCFWFLSGILLKPKHWKD